MVFVIQAHRRLRQLCKNGTLSSFTADDITAILTAPGDGPCAAAAAAAVPQRANPNAATGEGVTALMTAVLHSNAPHASALLHAGAALSLATPEGLTAALWATFIASPEVLNALQGPSQLNGGHTFR